MAWLEPAGHKRGALATVQLARQPAAAPSEPVSQWLAVVQSSKAEPLWLVNTDAKAARLHLSGSRSTCRYRPTGFRTLAATKTRRAPIHGSTAS